MPDSPLSLIKTKCMKIFDVYQQLEIELVKAKDIKLWDKNGVEYTDFYGGHAVISVGHSHPDYVAALTNQLNKISFLKQENLLGCSLFELQDDGPHP